MTQVIIILTAIALVMAVWALVGVGIVIHNIKSDKPPDSYYRVGGTDNDDTETVIKNEDIPVAYNVDKVVEQLEEARDELLHSTDYNNDIINYCLDWFDMAIDIVKGAVKDV